MIVSFYSYKGGVGRTQLCANLAAYLSIYKGKKILLWDWDFEAPGLHHYFDKSNEDINSKGTIELFTEYIKIMRSKSNVTKAELPSISQNYISTLLSDTKEGGKVDLMPAGCYSKDFARLVYDFSWQEFYEMLDGVMYIEIIKEQLKELDYDYVFIDSRTGISDYSGICNIQLPEINIILMAPNEQNFSGCKQIAEQIIDSEYVAKGYRRSLVMPILSKLDLNSEEYPKWIKRFNEEFSFMLPEINPGIDDEFVLDVFEDIYLNQTLLEYKPTISSGENRLFTDAENSILKISFERKYVNIANFIENLKKDGSLNIYEQIDNETWLDYAQKARRLGQNTKAIKAYGNAGDTDAANQLGGSSKTWHKMGIDYSINGDKDKAIECFQKAVKINPNEHSVWYNMGSVFGYNGDNDKAIECYQRAVEIKPDYHIAFGNMGYAYFEKGENDKAIECFKKVIEIKPNDQLAFWNMGNAYLRKGENDEAIVCYKKVIEIKPNDYLAFCNMGNAYLRKGENDEAIVCYKKVIEIKPNDYLAFCNMGSAYFNNGDNDKAIECYRKSIQIKPDFHEALSNLGEAYKNKGDNDKAIECYQKAIEIKPDNHITFNNLGLAYHDNGDKDKAIEYYQKAIQIKPDFHDALNNMGTAYSEKGDNDKAIECFKKTIQIKPDFYNALNNMGVVYLEKGENDKAIECFQKTIEIKPDDHGALMSIGFVYLKLGDLNLAKKHLTQSIVLGSLDLGNMNLGHVYFAEGELDLALKTYIESILSFENEEKFFEGFDDDFQYLIQYGITEQQYKEMRGKIKENVDRIAQH